VPLHWAICPDDNNIHGREVSSRKFSRGIDRGTRSPSPCRTARRTAGSHHCVVTFLRVA
jgi:hypothetical protein